jgi:CheY-like chemotaxis protein
MITQATEPFDPSEVLAARVLIVDDQQSSVLLLERMLREAGYTSVASTRDPDLVTELHRKNQYDLILLDLVMPVLDGFQVLESLKTVEKGSYLSVLVMTAHPGHKQRALQAGAKDFITKPFNAVEVLTRVYNLLELRLLHKRDRKKGRGGSHTQVRTLLYVEDNAANLKLVEQLVARRPNLRFLSAQDATLGIALALAAQPQVILMDINLPGMSGLEAMAILHDDPATEHIPVVALSAHAVPRDIAKALAAGFFQYLTKPLKIDEFMETLDTALAFTENALGQRKAKQADAHG